MDKLWEFSSSEELLDYPKYRSIDELEIAFPDRQTPHFLIDIKGLIPQEDYSDCIADHMRSIDVDMICSDGTDIYKEVVCSVFKAYFLNQTMRKSRLTISIDVPKLILAP